MEMMKSEDGELIKWHQQSTSTCDISHFSGYVNKLFCFSVLNIMYSFYRAACNADVV